jgi:hypothetical protein
MNKYIIEYKLITPGQDEPSIRTNGVQSVRDIIGTLIIFNKYLMKKIQPPNSFDIVSIHTDNLSYIKKSEEDPEIVLVEKL